MNARIERAAENVANEICIAMVSPKVDGISWDLRARIVESLIRFAEACKAKEGQANG